MVATKTGSPSWKVIDNTGISERPRNPRGVITAQGTGEGSKTKEIYDRSHTEDPVLKAARLKAELDEARRDREERKKWWQRLYEKINPPDEPFHPARDAPRVRPSRPGPEFGFPGGQLPDDLPIQTSVSDSTVRLHLTETGGNPTHQRPA